MRCSKLRPMSHALYSLLSDLSPPRVLVVGDLILDEYLRGNVKRISPEAPVPVLEAASHEQALGGAANVANNLAALGCPALLCGAAGDDEHGEALLAKLAAQRIDAAGVVTVAGRPTTHKLRVVAQGQHVLRIDRERGEPLPPEQAAGVRDAARQLVSRVDGVVCSDYNKGFLDGGVLPSVMQAAADASVPVVVDPKGRDYQRYRGARILTPNLRELQVAAGITVHGPADLERGARILLELTEAQNLLVTCGKDGMALFGQDGHQARIGAQAREVYDVTGAGDTVIAALAMALFAGATPLEAAQLANVAAGLVVGKLGTATVGREELLAYLDGHPSATDGKIQTQAALRKILAEARHKGQRVVFTNGCFDLLHAGHVRYLQAARAMGDLLVVGLNTDASVRDVKGPKRPFVGEQDRALVLAGLGCVDYVVLFAEPTPAEIIELVRPHVLVKGADYAAHEVVGRDTVEASGGRLELIPLVEGQSSSSLVATIVERYGQAGAKG